MVFMGDSEPGANIAQERRFDIGPTTWEILRAAYRISNEPFVPGGLLVGCGPRPVLRLASATDYRDAITPSYPQKIR